MFRANYFEPANEKNKTGMNRQSVLKAIQQETPVSVNMGDDESLLEQN
jgi:hypothetical protein